MNDALSDLCPWLYTDFWLWFCSLKANKWDGLNSSISFLQKTTCIVSSGVKAIKRWPWLMRWVESLIKSLIEPNAPTVLHSMCFSLIYYQPLNQHIAINLLNLCPFPEPNSRVLEPYTHSFSSSFLHRSTAARKRHLSAIQSGRIIHMSLSCNLLHYWGLREHLHPDSVLYSHSLCWE